MYEQRPQVGTDQIERRTAAGANDWMVMKPWNNPGKSRCTTGTPASRNRRA